MSTKSAAPIARRAGPERRNEIQRRSWTPQPRRGRETRGDERSPRARPSRHTRRALGIGSPRRREAVGERSIGQRPTGRRTPSSRAGGVVLAACRNPRRAERFYPPALGTGMTGRASGSPAGPTGGVRGTSPSSRSSRGGPPCGSRSRTGQYGLACPRRTRKSRRPSGRCCAAASRTGCATRAGRRRRATGRWVCPNEVRGRDLQAPCGLADRRQAQRAARPR